MSSEMMCRVCNTKATEEKPCKCEKTIFIYKDSKHEWYTNPLSLVKLYYERIDINPSGIN